MPSPYYSLEVGYLVWNIRHQLLTFMSISHFIHHVLLYAFPALLILIIDDIPLNYLEMGILGSLPSLIMAFTSPLIGYLGKKSNNGFFIVLLGIFLFAISSFNLSIANDFFGLFLGNVILGLGCTTYHPIGLGVCANSFSEGNRGKAMAINHAAGVIGTAVSPISTLSLAIFIFSWRFTFFFLGACCILLLIILILWTFHQNLTKRFDSLVIAKEKKNTINKTENNSSIRSSPHRNWILTSLTIIIVISALRGGVYRSISYFTTTLLKNFYNIEAFYAGVLTSFILLLGSISDIYGAINSDRWGPRGRTRIILISAFLSSMAISGLIAITIGFPELLLVVFGFSLFAIGFYLAGGTLQALQADLVPASDRTFFYSIVFSLGLVVSSISPTIFGALLDMFQSPVGGLLFMLILMIISFFITELFRRRLRFAEENNLFSY